MTARNLLWLTLLLGHVGVGAMWLGAMGYSLFVAQPRLARLVGDDPERVEEIHRELANGNRWRVVALIATLWVTGIGLVAMRPGDWTLIGVKSLALAGASGSRLASSLLSQPPQSWKCSASQSSKHGFETATLMPFLRASSSASVRPGWFTGHSTSNTPELVDLGILFRRFAGVDCRSNEDTRN